MVGYLHKVQRNSSTPRTTGDTMTLASPEVAPELQAGIINQEPQKVGNLRVSDKDGDWKEKDDLETPQDLEDQSSLTAEAWIIFDVYLIVLQC